MNYLLFVDGGDDAACYPANRLMGMTCAANGVLNVIFEGTAQDTTVEEDNIDKVALTITADTEAAVMKAIAQAANAPVIQGGVITVADDVNGVYLVDDITACAITLDA